MILANWSDCRRKTGLRRIHRIAATQLAWRLDRGSIRIRVRDEGDGFDPANVPDPTLQENLYKPRGRGLHLLNKMMDSVRFNRIGNQIEFSRRVKP